MFSLNHDSFTVCMETPKLLRIALLMFFVLFNFTFWQALKAVKTYHRIPLLLTVWHKKGLGDGDGIGREKVEEREHLK